MALLKGKAGQIGPLAIILAIVMIFVVGGVYIIISSPWDTIYNAFAGNLSAPYSSTALKIQSVWLTCPIIIIFGILLWMFVMLIRGRNAPPTGY